MSDATVRAAEARDFGAIVDVYLASRAAAMPWVTWAHDDDAVRSWFTRVMLPETRTWVAVDADRVAGFACVDGRVVTQFYVHPDQWRHGVGRALLRHAMARAPDGLTLRCFTANLRALRFYQENGFIETDRSDGSENEEREPDIGLTWRPT